MIGRDEAFNLMSYRILVVFRADDAAVVDGVVGVGWDWWGVFVVVVVVVVGGVSG